MSGCGNVRRIPTLLGCLLAGVAFSTFAADSMPVQKGCYSLQSVGTREFVSPEGGGYRAAGDLAASEVFFLKPATLGKYLIYAADRRYLTAEGNAVTGNSAPSDDGIWQLERVQGNRVRISSDTSRLVVATNEDEQLVLVTRADGGADEFRFQPNRNGCTEHPEMPLAVSGETFKGRGLGDPVVGFADIHNHMGMSSEMSYDDSVGPSAGGVLYGQTFHRFGVEHALGNCQDFHGPNGVRDANNILATDPTGTHDTQGWPTFIDWPARDLLTHTVLYHRWVERAYKAGLRLMVNHGTNIQGLCKIGQIYAGRPDAECDDMPVAKQQVRYMYDVQDYVDAQYGGPGKGWFRIVLSPQEAREVINDGKMAVILGVEVAQVFGCGVTFLPDGTEVRRCDRKQIDQEIQELWDLGVRHVYPFHDIDTSLGGTGLFSDILNYINFIDTGAFWKTTECRAYPEDEPTVRNPGANMTMAFPGGYADEVANQYFSVTAGKVPTYPEGPRCNERTVTDLGDYALRALMKNRMIIDIDHAAYHSKDIMLDIAEEQDPPYPLVSAHDAHGGLTADQALRMLRAGGVIYPYKGNGEKHRDFLAKIKRWRELAGPEAEQYPLALGYGADGNGLGGHPGPRSTAGDRPVKYPFTLFQGAEWGSQFAGIEPLQFELLTVPESGKFWHIDEVGMAHYGLVADFVEEVRLESGAEGLDALYNSAEAYIQMWERVWCRDGACDAPQVADSGESAATLASE